MALLVMLAALGYSAYWWLHGQFWVVTDNAFVAGNLVPVEADTTGIVTEVFTEETRRVEKGELLVTQDRNRAQATLNQRAGELGKSVRSLGALFANRRQLCQKLAARSAQLERVRHDVQRYREALPSGAVSEQILQNAEDQTTALEAEHREAQADLAAIEVRIGGTGRGDHPEVEAAKQHYVNAYLDLARQQIRAPVAGTVAVRKVQVGDRVHPGDPLLMLVPLEHLWVEANLRETELRQVRPGQPARITVDLYGNRRTLAGTVEGIHPGTGSVFALLPPDNASGNFIHIVQRVPVRIALEPADLGELPLRPGLSTVAAIDIGHPGQSPNRSLAGTAAPEFRTDIYASELDEGERQAQDIIAANLVTTREPLETGCAATGAEIAKPLTAAPAQPRAISPHQRHQRR